MKEILNRKRTSGISLVALIVTIIVLIILTAAVIVTFMEGGIVDRAKQATFKSDIRNYQDILLEKSSVRRIDRETGTGLEEVNQEINAETLAEIQEIIPEFKEEYANLVKIENGKLVLGTREDQPYRDWLIELGIEAGSSNGGNTIANGLKVGDYVNYSAKINGGTSSVEIAGEDSGYFVDENENWEYDEGEEQDQTITRDATINWRVLSIEGSTVTLISEAPIDAIWLNGLAAYLNGPDILDDTYDAFYSTSIGSARNLKVEDVNKVIGYTENTNGIPDYATSDVNDVYDREVGYGITIGELETEFGIYLNYRRGPRASGSDTDDIGSYRITYYAYRGSDYKSTTSDEYKMIFGSSNDYSYWLSSSSVRVLDFLSRAHFCVREVAGGLVTANDFYFSNGGEEGNQPLAGRPVVILNSSVEIDTSVAGKDGTSAATAWEIK